MISKDPHMISLVWWLFLGCMEVYTGEHVYANAIKCLRQGSKVREVAYASVFQLEDFVEAPTRSSTRGLLHDAFTGQM